MRGYSGNKKVVINGIKKSPYTVGDQTRYIPKHKVVMFVDIFNKIKDKVGTEQMAIKFCGTSSGTIYKMKSEGKLSSTTARKILDSWNLING